MRNQSSLESVSPAGEIGMGGHFCSHIRPFADRYADGTLPRALQWMLGLHVSRCRSCQEALAALRLLLLRLRQLNDSPTLPQERLEGARWSQIEDGWDAIEKRLAESEPPGSLDP